MQDDYLQAGLVRPSQLRYRRPGGRPMKIGKFICDPVTHQFGYYLGMCKHCNAKFTVPKEQLPEVVRSIKRSSKSWKVRLLKWLEKKLAA